MIARMPLWQEQQLPSWWGHFCHHNDSKDACALMMMSILLQWGQWCQLKDNNNAITTRGTTPLWIKGDKGIITRAMMSSWWRQGRLCINNGNNAIITRTTIAIMTMAKMPAHQWQQYHLNMDNGANSMTQQWQRRLGINNGNVTIVMRSTITIATAAKMPAHWWWQRQFDNKQQG
jgi:hypothetical protein